jgi:hypothetical protein
MIPWADDAMPGEDLRARMDRLRIQALGVGGVGLAISAVGWLMRPQQLLPAYLVAFLFWIGLGLGSLGLTMLHHLVGGQWGLPIRRPLEAGMMTLFPMALLFLPLAIGMRVLYPWARLEEVRLDPELLHKTAYLNPYAFDIRAAVYFGLWLLFALLGNRMSRAQDRTAAPQMSLRLQQLSGPGLVLLFLTSTFAAIDWGMSLEPKWFSTIYGAMLITGEALSTLAAMIVVAVLLAGEHPMDQAVTPTRLHDLGNLLLAFVMLWAYMAFSQFLIVWSGDLTEEITWYLRRTHGGWQWVALFLIGFHFFLPFFVLLFRESKRQGTWLFRIACLVLAVHLVDVIWLVIPSSADLTSPRIDWGALPWVLATTAGIGGIWIASFLWQLKGAPLIPLHDANLDAAIAHAGGAES